MRPSRASRIRGGDREDRPLVEEGDVDEVVVTRELRVVLEGPLLLLRATREKPDARRCGARRLVERRTLGLNRRTVGALRRHREQVAAVAADEVQESPVLGVSL